MATVYGLSFTLNGDKKFNVARQSGSDVTLSESGPTSISLNGLTVVKKIYYPCEINASLNLKNNVPGLDVLRTLFTGASASLKLVTVSSDNKPDFSKATGFAVDYVVADTVVEYLPEAVNVKLKICSPDYNLECSAFSRAYTGKRLSSVIKAAMPDLGMKAELFQNKVKYLLHKRPEGSGTVDDELIQPYMVQYNETFYSFARRIANRCGEFLYFEDGKFNLGLVESDPLDITSYNSLSFHKCERKSVSGAVSFTRNPVEAKDAVTPGSYTYNMEGVYEEYLVAINNDKKYDTAAYAYDARNSHWLTEFIATFCTSPSLFEAVHNYALSQLKARTIAGHIASAQNDKYYEKFFKKSGDYYSSSGNVEFFGYYDRIKGSSNDEVKDLCQFSTNPKQNSSTIKRDINNALLKLVRETQEQLWDKAIEIELGSNLQNISLGRKIKLSGKDGTTQYIVVEVSGQDERLNDKDWRDGMKIIAVPDVSGAGSYPIPPSIKEELVRRSGPQTARISTAELDPKRLERVRVRYWWQDGSGDESPWIRVTTLNARNEGGSYFKPEEGDECLLGFENGNIEKPYVLGYLNNSKKKARYGTREYSDIISNGGGQTIRMKDSKDDTYFWAGVFPVFSFLRTFIKGINNSEGNFRKVSGFTEITDEYGLYDVKMSSVDRKVSMKSPFGDIEISAFTGITLSAPNGDIKIQGKNVEITAGNNLNLISGANITDKMQLHSWNSKTDFGTALANTLVNKAVGEILDLSLLRCVFEMLLKPISGNLDIKSNRFLLLEAGKGKATLPWNAYDNTRNTGWSYANEEQYWLIRVEHDLERMVTHFKNLYGARHRAIETLAESIDAYKQGYNRYFDENSSWFSKNLVVNAKNERYQEEGLDAFKAKFKADIGQEVKNNFLLQNYRNLLNCANAINRGAYRLKQMDILYDNGPVNDYAGSKQVKAAFDSIKRDCKLAITDDQLRFLGEHGSEQLNENVDRVASETNIRKLIWAYLKQFEGKAGGALGIILPANPDFNSADGWAATINQISSAKDVMGEFKHTLKSNFFKKLTDAAGLVMGPARDRFSWASESTGEILMSQEANKVIKFGNAQFENHDSACIGTIKAKCITLGNPLQNDVAVQQ